MAMIVICSKRVLRESMPLEFGGHLYTRFEIIGCCYVITVRNLRDLGMSYSCEKGLPINLLMFFICSEVLLRAEL
jgi:hypothetical protein